MAHDRAGYWLEEGLIIRFLFALFRIITINNSTTDTETVTTNCNRCSLLSSRLALSFVRASLSFLLYFLPNLRISYQFIFIAYFIDPKFLTIFVTFCCRLMEISYFCCYYVNYLSPSTLHSDVCFCFRSFYAPGFLLFVLVEEKRFKASEEALLRHLH